MVLNSCGRVPAWAWRLMLQEGAALTSHYRGTYGYANLCRRFAPNYMQREPPTGRGGSRARPTQHRIES